MLNKIYSQQTDISSHYGLHIIRTSNHKVRIVNHRVGKIEPILIGCCYNYNITETTTKPN